MNFGITILFGWYTNQRFEMMMTKMITMLFAVIALLMVFVSGHQSEIIKDEANRITILVAIISACAFATLVMLDAFARSCFNGLRIFGEISILSGYACIWSTVFVIFGSYKDYSMVPKVSFGMVGFTVLSFIFTHQVRGRRNDPRLAVVLNRLGRYEDPNTVLHLATLLAIYMKPEKAETATLMEAVRKASPEVINVISSGDAANQTYLPNPTLSAENSYNESGESSYDMFDIFGESSENMPELSGESSENMPEVTRGTRDTMVDGTRDTVVEITDGTRGTVVEAGGISQPEVEATDGTSQPVVEASGTSQPVVETGGTSQPVVETGGTSQAGADVTDGTSQSGAAVTDGTRTVVESGRTRGTVVETGGTSQSGAAVTDGTRGKKKRKKKVIVNDCTRGPIITRSLFRRTTRSMTKTKGNQ